MYELEEIINEIRNYDNIIIYGAGLVSCAFVEYLLEPENDINITCIAVSNIKGNPKHILGIPVVEAENIKNLRDSCIVIIATLENYHYSIETWLQEQGFHKLLKITNYHYSLLRKHNREFSMDVLSELSGIRKMQEKANQMIMQKVYNLSQDIRKLKYHNFDEVKDNCAITHVPLISVIIPVYNVENYLVDCLLSVVNQTISGLEVICIDDGSTDHSLEILQQFAESYPYIKIINQENRGLSSARNTGLEKACGEFVYFLDSDDCIEKDALMEMYQIAHTEELDVLYIDGKSIYESSELEEKFPEYKSAYQRLKSYSEIVRGTELFCNMVECGTYYVQASLQLIRRTYLEATKLRFLEGILYEDNLFNFQCMLKANAVRHYNKPFFIRRIRKKSIMTSDKTKVENFYGYFITYIQMLSFAVIFQCDDRTQESMETVIQSIYYQVKRNYYNLPDEEHKKLEQLKPVEMLILKQLNI